MGFPVAIATGVGILQDVNTLFSGKDGERMAANAAAFEAAKQGDENALMFLRQRSGNYGTTLVPGYGEIGGWATAEAKADASAKFQQVNALRNIESATGDLADKAQDVAQGLGVTIVPGKKGQISMTLVIGVVVVAVVVLVAVKAFSKKR